MDRLGGWRHKPLGIPPAFTPSLPGFEALDPMGFQARRLEWVACPFSRGSSQPRDWIQVSRIAGGFFTSWTTREAHGVAKGWTWQRLSLSLSFLLVFFYKSPRAPATLLLCTDLSGLIAFTKYGALYRFKGLRQPCIERLSVPFFQHHLVTSCLSVTLW